ncbi:hypothetical protein [Methylomonas methanica]|uniref:Uncharacterized protein n=1 Tax=Methylomonas methanica TaxID=421 RepID=A0A177M964_METMH|nr:hypothetical protein [Methylomonas methanica]OAI02256.1 hypothetical protein A1332_16570 [Methylomonas methanica]
MDWTEGLKQISILIAAWVAIYGIDSWRREHAGKRRIELAEDALTLFYEAVDAIKWIRHPVSFTNETENIEQEKGETDANFRARKSASVVFIRYNQRLELFNKLHSMRYRFMAQIGKDKATPFDDLNNIVNEITGAARVLTRLWPLENVVTTEQWEQHRKQIQKYEAVFWGGYEEEDPITPKLNKVITEIEATCKAVITGKGSLHNMLNRDIF